ncbi:pentapeptide repeat-containing protein [Dactylosporangium sp. NPDC049140]|uniref:pentapeptide repeat-containing protein n=1 Tax=Dactylosporangium sp. NPDC049140 TaxID=3155647 RepID=UPI0033F14DF4
MLGLLLWVRFSAEEGLVLPTNRGKRRLRGIDAMDSMETRRRPDVRVRAMNAISKLLPLLRWFLSREWHAVLLPWGVFILVYAVYSVDPGWWDRQVSTAVAGAGRHSSPVVLFVLGGAAVAAWVVRRRRLRRGRRKPVAVWLPLSAHVGGLLVLAVGVASGMGSLLWWALGRPAIGLVPSTPTPGQAAPSWTVSNTFDAMKIVLSVVAGIGAVVALTVAYRKQDQGEAAEHREESKLFNDRFGKAADQLGSDKAAVRLAGVYAMAGLADDWREGRQTCIDVLCAYVRMPWPDQEPTPRAVGDAVPAEGEKPGEVQVVTPRELAEERQVRHAVIRVIREHLRPAWRGGDVDRWQGCHFDFSDAEFHGGNLGQIEVGQATTFDFSGATFSHDMLYFADATFSGGMVHFGHAKFSGGMVHFGHAKFSGSRVYFGGAVFSSGLVIFGGATFSDALVEFADAKFSGGRVDFSGATFSGGTVNLVGATFSGGSVQFTGVEIPGGRVDLNGATFSGGRVALNRATFSGGTVNLGDATFSGGSVDFGSSTFSGGAVDFGSSTFSGGKVDFSGATFSGSSVYLGGATFSGSALNFSDAKFSSGTVNFSGATFSGGTVDFHQVSIWSAPPLGLPAESAVVVLPPGAARGASASALEVAGGGAVAVEGAAPGRHGE